MPTSLVNFALSLIALALLCAGLWWSVGRVWRDGWRRLAGQSRVRVALAALAALFAIQLLRPHQDTFVGLDTSCYRLMTHALHAGRPLLGPDEVLLEAPREIRNAFLLMPDMRWRNSRDRSFEVMSLQNGHTQPFFYPLLPLAASGFDHLVPGAAADYFLPLAGVFCVAALLVAAAARGGGWGLAAAAAVLIGSPFPAWFFRGYFPEALGAMLLAGAVLDRPAALTARAFFPLGLAVSLHPLLVVLAIPIAGWRGFTTPGTRRDLLRAAVGALAGLLPLYAMTRWICQPYGQLLDVDILLRNLRVSGEHRAVMGAALVAGVIVVAWTVLRAERRQRLLARVERALASPRGRLLFLLVALAPLAVSLLLSATRDPVWVGAREWMRGVGAACGLLVAAGAAWLLLRGSPRSRLWMLLLAALLPVFLYLKGVEQVGLWSQRRLLPWHLALVAGLIPAAAAFRSARVSALLAGGVPRALAAGLLLLAAIANAARWPAPYLARFEAGADDWIGQLRARSEGRLLFFDYHSFSFPLAVDGRTRALGLGSGAHRATGVVMRWLREKLESEPLWIATAYANPGLEDGMRLVSAGMVSADVERVRARALLPAESFTRRVAVEFLDPQPLRGAERAALHKVFDGGPLALRGEWLPDVRRLQRGAESLPAQWSRAGSAVVGPVPGPGEVLRIRAQGVSGGRNPAPRTLYLEDEQGRRSPPMPFGDEWNDVQVLWSPAPGVEGPTTVYRLRVDALYDPASDGLRGYPRDLGMLLHRMDIEVIPAHTASLSNE